MSETKVPAIPAPTDANLRDVARAIKGVIDVREGLAGDPLDANVTFRELVDGGVVSVSTVRRGSASAVVITGPVASGSDGYDPTTDLTTPPAPAGFAATGLFASVQLQWDSLPSTYLNHAYAEIWRSETDVIGNAVLIGTSNTRFYVDYLGNNVSRFYWIRFVSQANVKGPYNGTPGTQATTAQNPNLLLNSLTTAITAGQLAASLGNRINLIDGADTLPDSVNARIKASQDTVTSLVTVPAYSNAKTYAAGELVTYNNNLYKALGATTGNLPTDTTKWKLVGQYSSLANSFAAVFTDYLTTADTNSAISSATSGLVSTTSLNTTLGNYVTTSTLTNDYYTKTATDSAISSATTNLVSQTSFTNTLNSYVTSATLTSNYYTKTATDSAISSATTNLVSQTSLNSTLSSYATTAALTNSYYTKTDTDSAISTASQTLVARYGELDAAVSWNFTGGVEGFTASGATLSSQGQFVRLTSTGSDPVLVSPAVSLNGATHTLIRARVRRVAGTGWQGDAYYTTSGHGVSNSFRSNIANTTALNEWRLLEWDMANLTAGGSDWTASTILSIRLDLGATAADVFDIDWVAIGRLGVGAYSSAIQTLATTTAGPDGATAQYTVKIDQGGHVTGYGLSSTANNATPFSEFGVRADRFWVAPPTFVNATAPTTGLYKGYAWRDTGVNPAVTRYWNGTAWTTTPQNLPFVVVTGASGTVNGVTVGPGVYIDSALIGSATITKAQIGSVDADTIQAGYTASVDLESATFAGSEFYLGGTITYEYNFPGQPSRRSGIASVANADIALKASGAEFNVTHFRIKNGGSGTPNTVFEVANGNVRMQQAYMRGLAVTDDSGNVILSAGSALDYSRITASPDWLTYGSNLQYNADFSNGLDGWTFTGGSPGISEHSSGLNLNTTYQLIPYTGAGTSVFWSRQVGSTNNASNYYEWQGVSVSVQSGKRYAISAYTGALRCKVAVFAFIYNSSNTIIANTYVAESENDEVAAGGSVVSSYRRVYGVLTMPANASYIQVRLRKWDTKSGQTDSYMFVTRVQVEEVAASATTPGPWAPSGYTDRTSVRATNPINSVNVSTYIAAGAIGNAYIGNFIQSTNFNGTIDSGGVITANGTTGWAISKSGKAVLDELVIRQAKGAAGISSRNPISVATPVSSFSSTENFAGLTTKGYSVSCATSGYIVLYLSTIPGDIRIVDFTAALQVSGTPGTFYGPTVSDSRVFYGGVSYATTSHYTITIPFSLSWLFSGSFYRSTGSRPPGMSGIPASPVLIDNTLAAGSWTFSVVLTVNLYIPGTTTLSSEIMHARVHQSGWAMEHQGVIPSTSTSGNPYV